MIQVLFTHYAISGIFLANPWVPIVLAHGHTSGLVLNVADTVTSVALVIEFQLIHEAITLLPNGSNDMPAASLELITLVRWFRLHER